jgi:hypothetical protein
VAEENANILHLVPLRLRGWSLRYTTHECWRRRLNNSMCSIGRARAFGADADDDQLVQKGPDSHF